MRSRDDSASFFDSASSLTSVDLSWRDRQSLPPSASLSRCPFANYPHAANLICAFRMELTWMVSWAPECSRLFNEFTPPVLHRHCLRPTARLNGELAGESQVSDVGYQDQCVLLGY
jgi:hypothetical protein